MVAMICTVCAKAYSVPPYRVAESRACSRKCLGARNGVRARGNRNRAGSVPPNKGTGAGYITTAGYRRIKVDGHDRMEHRVVWERANGPIPDGHVIHHLNHDRLDNRIENLSLMPHGAHSSHHGLLKPIRKGWKHSAETRAKMSAAAYARYRRP